MSDSTTTNGKDHGQASVQDQYTVEDVPLQFAPVPPELVLHRKADGKPLTYTAVRLWCMLAMHRNLQTSETQAGVVRMAAMLGVSRQMAQKAANELHSEGFLFYRPRSRDAEGQYTPAHFTLAIGGKRLLGVGLSFATMETTDSMAGADHGNHHGNSSFTKREVKDKATTTPPYPPHDHDNSHGRSQGLPDDVTTQCLVILSKVDGFPRKLEENAVYLQELREKFPNTDPVTTCDQYEAWHRDNPRKTKNFRLRLRNFFEKAHESGVTKPTGKAPATAPRSLNGAKGGAARRRADFEDVFDKAVKTEGRDLDHELTKYREENPVKEGE